MSSNNKKSDIKKISSKIKTKENSEYILNKFFSEENVLSKLSNEFKEKLNEELKDIPENMKILFEKYGKNIIVASANYIPKKINLDKEEMKKSLVDREPSPSNGYYSCKKDDYGVHFNQTLSYAVYLFIHECAHNIDYTAIKISDNDSLIASYNSENVGVNFANTLSHEANIIKDNRKQDFLYMSFSKFLQKYFVNPSKSKFANELKNRIKKEIERTGESEYIIKSKMKDKDQIVRTLFVEEINNFAASRVYFGATGKIFEIKESLLDIVSCGTKSDFFVGGGHSKEYCKTGGNTISTEAFAELTQAYCTSTEFVDMFEKYFPNSVKKYSMIIKYLNE